MTGLFPVPNSWVWSTLGEIAEVVGGVTKDAKKQSDPGYPQVPYLRVANVQRGFLNLEQVAKIRAPEQTLDKLRLHKGDVLLNEGGDRDKVGRGWVWNDEIVDCIHQNHVFRVRITDNILHPRLFAWYANELARDWFFANARQSVNLASISLSAIRRLPVPIPPPLEQRRIVTALDDYLSHLDKAESTAGSAAIRMDALRKRIIVDSVPDQAPAHWAVTNVGDAGHVELGRSRNPEWHTGPNMRPYLRVANIFEDRIDDSDLKEMHFPDEVFERYRLVEGDVLLNEGQSPEFLGRPALYRGHPKDVAFTNTLLRFRARPDVLPEWALLVFRRHMHAGRFLREVRITTNIAHLSASRLKPVEFPVPPLEEQEQIVTDVREKLNRVDRLNAAIEIARNRTSALRRSLLTEAFSGRLVPQDPSEEPVSEPLAQVRAEHANRVRPKRQPVPKKAATPAPTNPVQERLL